MATLDDLLEGAAIHDYVALWDKGTWLQAVRALGLPDNVDADVVEIEVHLFVVALRNLVRAVAWGSGHAYRTGDRKTASLLDRAINTFDNTITGLVDVRDIHEHFDAYERGNGTLGFPPHLPRWWEYDEHNTVVNVAGYRIDVTAARDAARVLADRAFAALN